MKKNKKHIINKFKEREAWSIIIFIFSIIIFLSIIGYNFESPIHISSLESNEKANHLLGRFGVIISDFLVTRTIGIFSIVLPIIMFMLAYAVFSRKEILKYIKKSIFLLLIAIALAALYDRIMELSKLEEFRSLSGASGIIISQAINDIFGIGFWILVPFIIVIFTSFLFDISLYNLFTGTINKLKSIYMKLIHLWNFFITKIRLLFDKFKNLKGSRKSRIEISKPKESIKNKVEDKIEDNEQNIIKEDKKIIQTNEITNEQIENSSDSVEKSNLDEENEIIPESNIEIEDEIEIEQGNLDEHESRKSKYRNYKLPLTDHLVNPINIDRDDDDLLTRKAKELQHALETFGVKSEVKRITQGPVITMFEVEPHEGVRVNKFTNLSDDLARVMAAQRIRVIAPIPGTRSIGIELPNENPSIVYLKTIINSEQYINSLSKLTIGLGKTTTGDAYIFDLAKMPHLLVAGATGSGKSVCINNIIISILYKAKPDEVKFILIDPKKLELSTYKSLVGYHLITAPNLDEYVMTTAENSIGILNSAITEMERRFQVFSDARVRNISEYHAKCIDNNELENIPYIVVLIDELADLMITSGKSIEDPITRLAQKARAVGIHLVVATQRPSVDVITGLIKSNFPARMSFQVSSRIDSRTILDQMGAEKLLGKGDMLFLLPGAASPIRLHNALVELDEIEKIMNYISSQPRPNEIHLPEFTKIAINDNLSLGDELNDELLYESANIVINNQQASVSLLQRKLRVGYSRAGRLIDELESLGIISEHNGSKPRNVLVDNNYIDNIFNK